MKKRLWKFTINFLGETTTYAYLWTDYPQDFMAEIQHKYGNKEVFLKVQFYHKNKWVTYDHVYWSPDID